MAKNELIISDGIVAKVRTLASFGYSDTRVCRMLRVTNCERAAISSLINKPGTELYEAYQSGLAEQDAVIDTELAKRAECGDTEAIETLDKRREYHKEKDLREKLFGV